MENNKQYRKDVVERLHKELTLHMVERMHDLDLSFPETMAIISLIVDTYMEAIGKTIHKNKADVFKIFKLGLDSMMAIEAMENGSGN